MSVPRVLILTTFYKPSVGGSELAIENLTKRLPEVHFDIITADRGGKWLFPVSGFFRALGANFDVLQVFQASYAGGAGWLLKLFFPKKPFIITLQEGKNLDCQSLFVKFFRRVILRKADVITAISNYLLAYAKKINPKAKLYLLPNGVDVALFNNPSQSPLVSREGAIISVSRLVPKNGLDVLIEAMPFLPKYTLEIAGTGPLEKELKMLVKKLGVENRVSFLGNVPHDGLPELLARAGVFARPSRSEGLGSAFLEAMAARIPVVATPVGGIPDFLKDHETGLFCEADDPQSVADAIKEILENESLREKIVKNAFALVREKYNWDILAKRYYEIIRNHSRI